MAGCGNSPSATVREDALNSNDLWVVSLELAAVNPAVQDAIRPDKAGWDLVVFDEAHRLTPTAAGFHQVGRLLAKNTPRALLMTATPHRGKEWLFRHLLHLVDPAIYPDPGNDPNVELNALRPGPDPLPAPDEGGPGRLRRQDPAVQGPHSPQPQHPALDRPSTATTRPRSTWSTGTSRRRLSHWRGWSTASGPHPACTPSRRHLNAGRRTWVR